MYDESNVCELWISHGYQGSGYLIDAFWESTTLPSSVVHNLLDHICDELGGTIDRADGGYAVGDHWHIQARVTATPGGFLERLEKRTSPQSGFAF